ncbi:hypothetical protein [Cerasicoccus frondis]|uniref:hypothetical protein n=1 Tax=Cerasicoccus frondis TaxID=490090 RepID=UPI002852AFA6|nr:hypothetical protein [Cerasicoccus frondis]
MLKSRLVRGGFFIGFTTDRAEPSSPRKLIIFARFKMVLDVVRIGCKRLMWLSATSIANLLARPEAFNVDPFL